MRKIIITITLLFCVVGFIGCDKDETPPQPPPSEYELQPCENTTEYLEDLHSIEIKVRATEEEIANTYNNYYLTTSFNGGWGNYTNIDFITITERNPVGVYSPINRYKICNLPDTVKNAIESGNSPSSIIISGKVFIGDWQLHVDHSALPRDYYNLELTSIRWGDDNEPQ